MAEYVCELGSWIDKMDGKKERVVRCRDCKRYTEIDAWGRKSMCFRQDREVEPDGFCAWGEPREVE